MEPLTALKIGYRGRPITDLDREELIALVVEIVQMINECASQEKKCTEVFTSGK